MYESTSNVKSLKHESTKMFTLITNNENDPFTQKPQKCKMHAGMNLNHLHPQADIPNRDPGVTRLQVGYMP